MEIKSFQCPRFRAGFLWNVLVNPSIRASEWFFFHSVYIVSFRFSLREKVLFPVFLSSYEALNISFQFGQLLTIELL